MLKHDDRSAQGRSPASDIFAPSRLIDRPGAGTLNSINSKPRWLAPPSLAGSGHKRHQLPAPHRAPFRVASLAWPIIPVSSKSYHAHRAISRIHCDPAAPPVPAACLHPRTAIQSSTASANASHILRRPQPASSGAFYHPQLSVSLLNFRAFAIEVSY